MGKFSRLGNELYNGHRSIDFVHKRPLWYSISGGIVLAALLVVIFNGFNFGYPKYYHRWDQYHYYMGAKYFPELNYDLL